MAAGLAVFALAALAGFVTAAQIAPERLRAQAEQVLSELTHARVSLGSVHLTWAEELPWIQLRALDADLDWGEQGSFRATQLSAALNPLSLAMARLDVRDVTVRDARWVLPAWPDAAGAAPPEPAGLGGAIGWLAQQGDWLREHPCPSPSFAIQRLSIWQLVDGVPTPLLRDAQGGLDCSALGFRGEVNLHGTVVFGNATAPLRMELRAGSGEVELVASASEAPLPGWADALHLETALTGEIGGTLRWRMPEGGPQLLDLNLRGTDLAGPVGTAAAPATVLALGRPRLRIEASGTPRKLDVRFAELTDGNVSVHGEAAFRLPVAGQAPFHAKVEVNELDPAGIAHVLAQLPPGFRASIGDVVSRFDGGIVERLVIGLRTTADGFSSITQRGPLTRPGDLTVDLAFRDASVRVGEADRVDALNGRVHFDGDRLEISGLSARFGSRHLARVDAALVGLHHLDHPEVVRCDVPADIDTLPGLDSFAEWRSSRRAPGQAPGWQKLRLELDYADHPLLLCALEDVAAELVPDANGLDARITRARWAGLPIQANATYREGPGGEGPGGDGGTGDRVVLTATIGAPGPAAVPADDVPAPDAHSPERTWARGRFTLEATHIGEFRIRGARGEIEAAATHLSLRDTVLDLDPGGTIHGQGEIELGQEGVPTYRAALEFADVPLLDLWSSAGLERGLLSGHLHGAAAIEGPLVPNENPLAHVRGALSLNGRDGEIRQEVPFVLALAMAGKGLGPFGDRDRIAYDAIDLVGRVEEGVLEMTNLTLTSPDLRGAASGNLDFGDEGELEMVVGLFFFPRLDGLIGKIPLLNRVILGRDRNLVGAYFAVEGPLAGPSARVLPTRSLVQGAGGMVMAVPAFVLSGIQQIQSLVIPQSKAPEGDRDPGREPAKGS